MKRTPLDGRARRTPEVPARASEVPKAKPASMSYSASLKEASPPKTNPWRRAKAASPRLHETPAPLDRHDWPRAEEAATAAEVATAEPCIASTATVRAATVEAPTAEAATVETSTAEASAAQASAAQASAVQVSTAQATATEASSAKVSTVEAAMAPASAARAAPAAASTAKAATAQATTAKASYAEASSSKASTPKASSSKASTPKAAAAQPTNPAATAVNKSAPGKETAPSACAAQQSPAPAAPSSSREILQAAAARAGESLWNLPFGADVWLYAEDKVIHVHRSVVAPKSGWIRDKLLPPHANGAPVGVYFAGAAKIIGHSLKFMYTDRLEPCEPIPDKPRDITHVACSSLFYLVAVDLRAHGMAATILDTLTLTSEQWKTSLVSQCLAQPMSRQEGIQFTLYLRDALDAAYAYPFPDIVAPLKMALVAFVDIVLPLMVQCPTAITLFATPFWQCYSPFIMADMIEHRRRERSGHVPSWTLGRGETLEALFEQAPAQNFESVTWPSRGPLPRASAKALGKQPAARGANA